MADFAEETRLARGGEELRTVGGEGERGDVAAMAGQRARGRVRRGVEQFDFAVASGGEEFRARRMGERGDGFRGRDFRRKLRDVQRERDGGCGGFCAGVDPRFNQRDFSRFQMLLLSGRHELVLALLARAAFEKFHEPAVGAFAGDNRRAGVAAFEQRGVGFEHEAALGVLGRVAVEAVLLEERGDVFGEIGRLGGGEDAREARESEKSEYGARSVSLLKPTNEWEAGFSFGAPPGREVSRAATGGRARASLAPG